jgi:hypothetical protein
MDTQPACKDRGATTAIAKPHEADMMLLGLPLLNDRFEAGCVETMRLLDALGLRFRDGADDTRPVAAAIRGNRTARAGHRDRNRFVRGGP